MSRIPRKLEKIEQEAMRLFGGKGVHAVSVREIAEAAGAAEGTLYRHYTSKEEMARRLYQRELGVFGENLRRIFSAPSDFQSRLKEGITAFYDLFDRAPVVFNFIILLQHNFSTLAVLEKDRNPKHIVVAFVKRGMDAGVFHKRDPEITGAMIYGIVLQPVVVRLYNRISGDMSAHAETVYQACMRVLQ